MAYFGPRTIQNITRDDVLSYIAARKQSGISNATINRERDSYEASSSKPTAGMYLTPKTSAR